MLPIPTHEPAYPPLSPLASHGMTAWGVASVPGARRLSPAEAGWAGGRCGWHSGPRRCVQPAAVVTYRYFAARGTGLLLLAERFVCTEHGEAFARRYGVEVETVPEGDHL